MAGDGYDGLDLPWVMWLPAAGGRIIRTEDFWDAATFRRQMTVTDPNPPERTS